MNITDELLFAHAAEARDLWLDTLPGAEELIDYPCSKSFTHKMNRLLKEQRHSPRANSFLRVWKQGAAAILAVAILSFGGLMSVQADREQFVEWMTQIFHEFTEFHFLPNADTPEESTLPAVEFSYLPQGMTERRNELVGTAQAMRVMEFADESGLFVTLHQSLMTPDSTGGMILDTEDAFTETLWIDGNEVFCTTKGGMSSMVWVDGSVVYHLTGTVELDELKEMAKKMKKG